MNSIEIRMARLYASPWYWLVLAALISTGGTLAYLATH
jgi:hypothetical protein